MPQFNLAEAKARFSELVQKAMLGEEVIVAKENKPVVRIAPIKPVKRKSGTGKGIWMSSDFDEPLDDFREYMFSRPSNPQEQLPPVHPVQNQPVHR